MSEPVVIGIDASMTATGIAFDGGALTVSSPRVKGDDRLWAIYKAVYERSVGASLAVIEDLPAHAQSAGITGMAQGVVRLALRRADVPYATVAPATLKKYATGRGNAQKPDMRMALYQRTGLDLRDDNQVDSAWLRFMGLDRLGVPAVKLPAVQRESMRKVAWPAVGTIKTAEAAQGEQ